MRAVFEHGGDDGTWGICGACSVRDVQPFCQCGEGIPFSSWVWKPAAAVCIMDGDGQRGFRIKRHGGEKVPGEDYRADHRENHGLWIEGFYEHGGVHGSGRL